MRRYSKGRSPKRPYNPNTMYGRRGLRREADERIANYTPEEKQSYDEIGCGVKIILFAVLSIIGYIIYLTSGMEGLIKWLK